MLDVDFTTLSQSITWEADLQERLDQNLITLQRLIDIERNGWNVVKKLSFVLAPQKQALTKA